MPHPPIPLRPPTRSRAVDLVAPVEPVAVTDTVAPAALATVAAVPDPGTVEASIEPELVCPTPAPPMTQDPTVTAVAPSAPPTEFEPTELPTPARSALESAEQGIGMPTTLGLGAATLLATGSLGVIGARRRRALRSAPLGGLLARPEDALVELERALRHASAGELVARVELAVRAAVAGLAGGRLLGVLVEPTGELTVLLDGAPAVAPAPFVATSVDRWTVPASVATAEIPSGSRFAAFPCPALVQLGEHEGAALHLDLEAVGVLAIDGPPRQSRGILANCLFTLAASPFGPGRRLVAVGIDPSVVAADPDAQLLDDAGTALELAAGHLGELLGVLRPGTTSAALRASSAGEPWEPVVIAIGAGSLGRTLARDVVELGAEPGRGLAVISDSPELTCRWRLVHGEHDWVLEPLGLRLRPLSLAEPTSARLARLIESADHPPRQHDVGDRSDAVDADDAADAGRPASAPVAVAGEADEPYLEPDWSLLVRTFGPPRVVDRAGTEVAFARSKSLELVCWLTRHRRTATRGGARSALWEAEVTNGTFANVVSDARQSLAGAVEAPAGEHWLGRTLTEQLLLHPGVVSDVELLDRRLRHARRQDSVGARRTLGDALELFGGAPFDAAGYLWPDAEGLVSNDALLATTVAGELAELCLEAGDLDGVFRATSAGLAVLPGHEELLALRMRAHAANGDLAAVKREWESYARIVAADLFGDGEPSARLVRLRTELLGERRAQQAGRR